MLPSGETDRPAVPAWAHMCADAVSLTAFVVTGAASHHDASFGVVLARNLGPWALAWVGASAVFGTYRRPSWRSLAATWAVAAPLGLLGRSLVAGEPTGLKLVQFLLVGGVFSLLYLLAGRAVLRLITRGRARTVQA